MTIFELSLEFSTPLIISEAKADIPAPGLPNLDGILKFAAYYWCVKEAIVDYPEMSSEYLMQINEALHGNGWIDFPIPLRHITLQIQVSANHVVFMIALLACPLIQKQTK